MKFDDLSLTEPLLRAVTEAGYTSPSPIQEQAIPPVLQGRDLLGCAQTGTGKTAAFALPILQLLAQRPAAGKRPIRALVLTPTRELALQIQESFETYGRYVKLKSAVIFGGVGQNPQVEKLRRGVDILVATPGRLNDLIGQGHIQLNQLEIFVLDEADRMLDMGFVHDVKKVLRLLPEKKQTLLFSATMPGEIVKLADGLLHNPAKVFVTPVSSTVEKINQSLYKVDKTNKRHLLAKLLKEEDMASALVFTRTKHGADRVVRELSREGVAAMAIHGNKSQNARQDALARFKDGRIKVLVATDIAARGLDINELSHVINYDLPNIPETYVHRIGRTGRAGHGGTAISFSNFDELEYLRDIEKLIGLKIPEVTSHDWPMEILEKSPPSQQGRRGAQAPAPNKAPGKQPHAPRAQAGPKGGKKPDFPQAEAVEAKAASAQKNLVKPAQDKNQPMAAAPVRPKNTPKQQAAPPRNERAALAKAPAPVGAVPKQASKPAAGAKQRGRRGPLPYDPYENLTGGKAIVTKRPVWADETPAPAAPSGEEGEQDMSRNNRRRSSKNRAAAKPQEPEKREAAPVKEKPVETLTPNAPNGVYDFTEAELAQDKSIRVISRTSSETKYASFDDYLKDH